MHMRTVSHETLGDYAYTDPEDFYDDEEPEEDNATDHVNEFEGDEDYYSGDEAYYSDVDLSQIRINGRPIYDEWGYGRVQYARNDNNEESFSDDGREYYPPSRNDPDDGRGYNNFEGEGQTTVPLPTKAQEGEETCFICLDNKPDSAFDCGNSGFCCVCAEKLLETTQKCPLCRKTVTSFRPWKPSVEESKVDVSDAWND